MEEKVIRHSAVEDGWIGLAFQAAPAEPPKEPSEQEETEAEPAAEQAVPEKGKKTGK